MPYPAVCVELEKIFRIYHLSEIFKHSGDSRTVCGGEEVSAATYAHKVQVDRIQGGILG